jgi:hypothetical protein
MREIVKVQAKTMMRAVARGGDTTSELAPFLKG